MLYSAAENRRQRSWKDHLGNWRVYAAAAGATLANASSAEANIIYTVAQPPIEAKFAHPLSSKASTRQSSRAAASFTIRGKAVNIFVSRVCRGDRVTISRRWTILPESALVRA